jgi:hypothetical protein
VTVERNGDTVRLVLSTGDVQLLRHALERASFIDTPIDKQAEIATFCARVLEALPKST